MRPLTSLMLACCLLSGCAAGMLPTPDPDEPVKAQPPANLTAPPRRLPQARSGQTRDLETNHQAVAKAYHRLASQMCLLQAYLQITHPECDPWLRVAPEEEK